MTVNVPLMPQTQTLRHQDSLLIRRGDHTTQLTNRRLADYLQSLVAESAAGHLTLPTDEQEESLTNFLDFLERAGLTTQEDIDTVSSAARSLWALDPEASDLHELQERLRATRVAIVADSPLSQVLRTSLDETQVPVSIDHELSAVEEIFEDPAALPVVIGDHLRDRRLIRANDAAVRTGRRWMPVVESDGVRTLIGPWMVPSSSACLECVWLRRAANSPDPTLVDQLVEAESLETSPRRAVPAGHDHVVAGILSQKIVELIGLGDRASAAAPGRMCVISRGAPGLTVEEQHVLRVPRCPVCSPTRGRGNPQVWAHPAAQGGEKG